MRGSKIKSRYWLGTTRPLWPSLADFSLRKRDLRTLDSSQLHRGGFWATPTGSKACQDSGWSENSSDVKIVLFRLDFRKIEPFPWSRSSDISAISMDMTYIRGRHFLKRHDIGLKLHGEHHERLQDEMRLLAGHAKAILTFTCGLYFEK